METILCRDFDLTEFINGKESMGPSPFGKHQSIAANLFRIFDVYVQQKGLGRVYFSPLDVIFKEGVDRLQPDLLFIKKENMWIFQDWVRGIPDMVCEIISQGSYSRDTIIKKEIYETYKVPEYWIIIPELEIIQVLTIEGERYRLFSSAEGQGNVSSKVIEGLQINIKEVFIL
ncbi:MAG: Uma2 family endonuclease [Candidatus Magnetoovum sp. WYHC-5]|nr:Uma2 family endonuclease [Candidatus Magnetoovum sp. WYHC-5]